MIGPLPARYRYIVLSITLLACLGLAVWLARDVAFPFKGYVIGIAGGLGLSYLLLHDFSRPVEKAPLPPA